MYNVKLYMVYCQCTYKMVCAFRICNTRTQNFINGIEIHIVVGIKPFIGAVEIPP